jgi:short-subunit dehydrogenase involved in D-alanine esterification of teichoic acids
MHILKVAKQQLLKLKKKYGDIEIVINNAEITERPFFT